MLSASVSHFVTQFTTVYFVRNFKVESEGNKSEAPGHIGSVRPPQIDQAHRVVYIYTFIMARPLKFPNLLNGGGEFKRLRVEVGSVTFYEGLTPYYLSGATNVFLQKAK